MGVSYANDSAIGQLLVLPAAGPAVEGFEPVMLSAIARQVPRHGQATGGWIGVVERDGVVDVGNAGGSIAAREATRQVAEADPALQRRRRLVALRFRRTDSRALDRQPRRRLRELAHLLGINHDVALQIPGLLAVPVDSVLTCDHVDHRAHPARGHLGVGAAGRAVRLTTVTRQCATLQQCRQRVSGAGRWCGNPCRTPRSPSPRAVYRTPHPRWRAGCPAPEPSRRVAV
jgi:hypothetical protein